MKVYICVQCVHCAIDKIYGSDGDACSLFREAIVDHGTK